jgi:Protein of unknown function (DUF1236)
MRSTVIGATTAALLCTTAMVYAQPMQEQRGKEPSAKEQAEPRDKAGDTKRSAEPKDKADDSRRSAEPRDKAGDTKRSAEPRDKADDSRRSAEPKDKAGDTKRSAEPKNKADDSRRSAEPRDKAGDTKRSAEPKDKADDSRRSAEPRRDDGRKSAEPQDKGDRSRDTARDRDRQRDQAADKDRQRGDDARVNLSQDQRTRVHERLSSHREARVTNVNFSINVGTRVPRDFRVHVIPQDIVAIVPQYRGYRYFIVEERVVIVHPSRYEIVEVIELGGPRRGGATVATLSLTPSQRTFIVQHLRDDRVARDVSIDLALGAEIPRDVELSEFPRDVVVEIPALKGYRYAPLERRIAIVEPSNRTVVEVIDR